MAKIDANSVSVENKKIVIDESRQICVCCSSLIPVSTNKFFTNRSVYMNSEIFGICKDCIDKLKTEDELEDLLRLFRFLDIPLYKDKWDGVVENNLEKNFLVKIGRYMSLMAFLKDKGYDQGDIITLNTTALTTSTESIVKMDEDSMVVKLTADDIEAKENVINLMGYDAFAGYSEEDKQYLYGNMMLYLNEDTLGDGIKLSAYIQIVNNLNQIRKIDVAISRISTDIKSMVENAKGIDTLQGTKSKIVSSNDKIMKENSISIKNRADKKAGTSTLTGRMRLMREMNFDDAEEDFYDQRKAKGMQMVADISNKSLMSQLLLDENDYVDIIKTQRDRFKEFEKQIAELHEKNRVLERKVIELKNEEDE